MQMPSPNVNPVTRLQLVMAYAAELELEVDRLRRRDQFVHQAARDHVSRMIVLCQDDGAASKQKLALTDFAEACGQFRELLRDVNEPSGYHPAFDQVIAIAVRPLTEQVFRWQQRLNGATNAVLHLDLQPDYIDWFPARLRHILDNLIANALQHCDISQGAVRISLALRVLNGGYELQLTDIGSGTPAAHAPSSLDLFHRAAPTRAAGLGIGLAVVKFLVEQCCGTFSATSGEGQGTNVTVVLPRFDVDDHVD